MCFINKEYNTKKLKGPAFILIFVFLSPFVIAIGAIYYIGHTNSSKIENFFVQNKCENIYNYKTKYKALCKEGIVLINDFFIIDFESNQRIDYANIDRIEKDETKVYMTYETQASVLEFEQNEDARLFYNNLHNKIPMRH